MSLLEEFAENMIICDSGDGSSIKVKDVKGIGFDSTMVDECYVNTIDYLTASIILKGENGGEDECEKGTPEFEKALENYLISSTLK